MKSVQEEDSDGQLQEISSSSSQPTYTTVRHRTQVILPVIRRTRITESRPHFVTRVTEEDSSRPSSAPSSPIISRQVLSDSSGGNRLTFRFGSSPASTVNRTRHYSLSGPAPQIRYSFPTHPTDSGVSTLRVSISPGASFRLTHGDHLPSGTIVSHPQHHPQQQQLILRRIPVESSQEMNLNFNRQVSTPIPQARGIRSTERKTSLEVPPRPPSISPTVPNRLFSVPQLPPRRIPTTPLPPTPNTSSLPQEDSYIPCEYQNIHVS